jgi:hypothetical protein
MKKLSCLFSIHLSMQSPKIDPELAREAKAIVALAFRNGPIESIHSGKTCPACSGKAGYSRITDAEMKLIMKNAVDHVYKFSVIKKTDPLRYQEIIKYGNEVAHRWEDPAAVQN